MSQLKKFFLLDTKGVISTTKFFSVVISIIAIVLFIYVVIFQVPTQTELWLTMLGAFLTSRSWSKFLELKYQGGRGHKTPTAHNGVVWEEPEEKT